MYLAIHYQPYNTNGFLTHITKMILYRSDSFPWQRCMNDVKIWNCTQSIFPVHKKKSSWYYVAILGASEFRSSCAFWNTLQEELICRLNCRPYLIIWLSDTGRTRSMSLLLMSCPLGSPGRQQPLSRLHRMNRTLFSMRKGFNCLFHLSIETWKKTLIYLYISSNYFNMQRVKCLDWSTV